MWQERMKPLEKYLVTWELIGNRKLRLHKSYYIKVTLSKLTLINEIHNILIIILHPYIWYKNVKLK